MKQMINENDLNQVVGGTVCLSEAKNRISFTTLGEGYAIKCGFKEARSLLSQLFAANADMTEAEFDQYVKSTFQAKGWI
jgi:hypothetical protein